MFPTLILTAALLITTALSTALPQPLFTANTDLDTDADVSTDEEVFRVDFFEDFFCQTVPRRLKVRDSRCWELFIKKHPYWRVVRLSNRVRDDQLQIFYDLKCRSPVADFKANGTCMDRQAFLGVRFNGNSNNDNNNIEDLDTSAASVAAPPLDSNKALDTRTEEEADGENPLVLLTTSRDVTCTAPIGEVVALRSNNHCISLNPNTNDSSIDPEYLRVAWHDKDKIQFGNLRGYDDENCGASTWKNIPVSGWCVRRGGVRSVQVVYGEEY